MNNQIDKKIIQLLTEDARKSHVEIAEAVGLSRPAVAERLKKMEQSGIVQGYTAVLDPKAVGKAITAFVSCKQVTLENRASRHALMNLRKDERVLEVHHVAGEDCFLLKIRCADVKALNELVTQLGNPPYSMTTRTTIALESYFEKVGGTVLCSENDEPESDTGKNK